MLPPDAYLQARRSAEFHVQVQVTAVRFPSTFPGDATVQATVRTVFRGADALSIGSSIEVAIGTCRREDPMPAGPVIWITPEFLASGRGLEAFLNGNSGTYSVAASQVLPIEGPTETPKMNLTEL